MSSSILEQVRCNHELAEAYDSQIGQVLNQTASNGQRAKVIRQHHIAQLVNKIVDVNNDLKRQYADSDSILAEEISFMRGANNMFSSFYESLDATKKYHEQFPNMQVESVLLPTVDPSSIKIPFSGDEVFGKYLDLHELFHKFSNIPGIVKETDYLQYLNKFNNFFYIPETCKYHKVYRQYLEELWKYLISFFQKIQPLVKTDILILEWNKNFIESWDAGKIQGWVLKSSSSSTTKNELRLTSFNSPAELEALGPDRLKEGLEALGLKCGGTLRERAERLWSVRGLKAEDYPKKLLAKPATPLPSGGDSISNNNINSNVHSNINSCLGNNNNNNSSSNSSGGSNKDLYEDKRKQIAWDEFKIICLCEIMMDIITSTRRHSEKQQTRTREEKEKELYEEEFGILQDVGTLDADSDDDEPIYNPLNIPLGWDGKPIPYWLYKLHGLGVEYKCEICGNQSYWGRKQFDRHFQEPKHAQGMRALGIPNTKHFHDITKMEDAKALFAKIRHSIQSEQFVAAVEAEFEDSHGNILNKRTYEDLARQGLL